MNKIYFPLLHPELVKEKTKQDVIFIDPGIEGNRENPMFFRPKEFPLGEKECKKYVNELLMYGDFFKDPREIQHNFLLQILSKEEERPTEIKRWIKKGKDESYKPNFYLLAQITLLLQWILEERIIELEKLTKEVDEDFKKLKELLNSDLKNDQKNLSHTKIADIFTLLPYDRTLPWFFLVMKDEDVLVMEDLELFEKWLDFEIEFNKLEESSNIKKAYDYGWRFIFKKRPEEKMSWLNKKYTIYYLGEEP